jgi:hypothetical protein
VLAFNTGTFVEADGGVDNSIIFRTGALSGTAIIGRAPNFPPNSGGMRIGSEILVGGYTTPLGANTYGSSIVPLTTNPFVDGANLDFRLTEDAKAAAYASRLRKIMAGLVGVPGITTDTLDELIGGAGGGSAGFTGIRGTTRTIGT